MSNKVRLQDTLLGLHSTNILLTARVIQGTYSRRDELHKPRNVCFGRREVRRATWDVGQRQSSMVLRPSARRQPKLIEVTVAFPQTTKTGFPTENFLIRFEVGGFLFFLLTRSALIQTAFKHFSHRSLFVQSDDRKGAPSGMSRGFTQKISPK